MYDLKIYPTFTILGIKDRVAFFAPDGTVLHEVVIAQNIPSDATITKQDEKGNMPLPAFVVTLEYCLASKLFIISMSDKSMQHYQMKETDGNLFAEPLGERISATRTIVCMKIAPKHGVLFGCDKSDCYEYDLFGKSDKQSKWILGHMSQILDLSVSEDERYIITCDRDEKIKVTSYPDCHNIVCYCLGHLEYVAGIEFVLPQQLLSVSGDKTLRLWDYSEGKETCSLTLQDPAVGVTLRRINDSNVVLCAVRSYVENKIEVVHINPDDPLKTCVSCEALSVDADLHILNAVLNSSLELIILAIDKQSESVRIMVYGFDQNKRRFEKCADNSLQKRLQNHFKESKIDQVRNCSTLFKNSIDNLSDYFERKKQKIGNAKANK